MGFYPHMFFPATGSANFVDLDHMGSSAFFFWPMMLFGWLICVLIVIALVLVIVWLWKQINRK
jgi:hypothetical protein